MTTAVSAGVLLCAGVGCASDPPRKAYAGELAPEQRAQLLLDDRVRLVSVDGQTFPGATDDASAERERALTRKNEGSDAPSYAQRAVEIPAGEHELIFGVARHVVPVALDTPVAVALLTGHVSYRQRMYPGGAEQYAYRLPAAAGHVYPVFVSYHREGKSPETWSFKIRDKNASRPVAAELGPAKSDPTGTSLSPGDWAEQVGKGANP